MADLRNFHLKLVDFQFQQNLNNLNAEIDFTNEKITRLVSALKNLKKEKDRSYNLSLIHI